MAESARSATRVLLLGGLLLVAVVLAVVLLEQNQAHEPRFCQADGYIGESGEIYGRDPDQDCQFVDGDGKVVDVDSDGNVVGG